MTAPQIRTDLATLGRVTDLATLRDALSSDWATKEAQRNRLNRELDELDEDLRIVRAAIAHALVGEKETMVAGDQQRLELLVKRMDRG